MYKIKKARKMKRKPEKQQKNTSQIKPPTQKEIRFCISLYFGVPQRLNHHDILFRFYLREITKHRNFIRKVDKTDKDIFFEYINSIIPISKMELSKKYYNGNTYKGQKVINKYLSLLVSEIMKDYENGLLQVQPYQKPPTQRERTRKMNEYLKSKGMNVKIPLRRKSKQEQIKEALKRYEDTKQMIYNEINRL